MGWGESQPRPLTIVGPEPFLAAGPGCPGRRDGDVWEVLAVLSVYEKPHPERVATGMRHHADAGAASDRSDLKPPLGVLLLCRYDQPHGRRTGVHRQDPLRGR